MKIIIQPVSIIRARINFELIFHVVIKVVHTNYTFHEKCFRFYNINYQSISSMLLFSMMQFRTKNEFSVARKAMKNCWNYTTHSDVPSRFWSIVTHNYSEILFHLTVLWCLSHDSAKCLFKSDKQIKYLFNYLRVAVILLEKRNSSSVIKINRCQSRIMILIRTCFSLLSTSQRDWKFDFHISSHSNELSNAKPFLH